MGTLQPTTPSPRRVDAEEMRARIAGLQRHEASWYAADLGRLVSTAAVVDTFEVEALFRVLGIDPNGPLLKAMLERCEVSEDGRWQLRQQSRRDALRSLGSRESIWKAREDAASLAPPTAVQRAIDSMLLPEQASPVDKLSAEDAAGVLSVSEWFEGIVEGPYDTERLTARLSREKLLHPLRRLTGDSFVGRVAEMAKLGDYVGVLPAGETLRSSALGHGRRFIYRTWRSLRDNPPVYVAGPGGVGKSSLIANFILSHVDADEREHLPFVLLDYDRAQVDSDEPLTLLIAATQQLRAQFPAHAARLDRMAEQLAMKVGSTDDLESVRSDSLQGELIVDFARVVGAVLKEDAAGCPLLWVLDTFEEPQRKGEGVVGAIWELLTTLQGELPMLRVVICGRVVPQSFRWDLVSLDEFDAPSAQAYLSKRLAVIGGPVLSHEEAKAVSKAVGFSPLALRLAARLISDAGPDALGSIDKRRALFFSLRSDQIQAVLFHRILEHIKVIDAKLDAAARRNLEEKLRQLAFPGLAVRRVTVDVIEKVLARPCGIRLAPGEAEVLYRQLSRQVDIVEQNDLDPDFALMHRSDVRRMMLRDLQEHAGAEVIAAINRSAVRYYADLPGVHERSEEIYHRLRLGQSPQIVSARWLPGVEKFLVGALDDIEAPAARVFLATQAGISLESESLRGADQGQWEAQVLLRARRYLRAGHPERALEVLHEREERLPGSELLLVEAQALLLARHQPRALALAQRSLDEALVTGRLSAAIDAALLASQVHEGMDGLDAALELAQRAAEWARHSASEDDRIRLVQAEIAALRLARASGKRAGEKQQREAVARRARHVARSALRARPALVRELVAELGEHDARFLELGLELLGLDLQWDDVDALVQALEGWFEHLASPAARYRFIAAAQSHGVLGAAANSGPPSTSQWRGWLADASDRDVGRLLGALLKAEPPPRSAVEVIVRILGAEVNRRIRRVSKARLL